MTSIRAAGRSALFLAVAVILVPLFCGCGRAEGPASFEEVAAAPPDHSSPQGIVRSFLTRIGTGRFAQAHDITSPRARQDVPLEEFVELHARALDGALIERFDIVKAEETEAGRVDVHIKYNLLVGRDHRHTLEKVYTCVAVDGGWWVDYTPTKRLQPADEDPDTPAAGA